MRTLLIFIIVSMTNVSHGDDIRPCNNYGGQKTNAWWAFQECDFITKAILTPMMASQRTKAETFDKYFSIFVTMNDVIIKEDVPNMYPPFVTEATLVIDSNQPFTGVVFNYGFYPIVRDPIREAHISKDDYKRFISEIKKGKELRVLWKQNSFPPTYQLIFSLDDAKESIEHLENH